MPRTAITSQNKTLRSGPISIIYEESDMSNENEEPPNNENHVQLDSEDVVLF